MSRICTRVSCLVLSLHNLFSTPVLPILILCSRSRFSFLQVEELKRGGTLEGSAMEEALQTSNLQLKKSSDEIISLRAANRKLSEDKAKLISDNTELANRFDNARQALAKHVGRERGGGAVGKGFIGEMQGNSALEKRLKEMEQRATVAAEGFQVTVPRSASPCVGCFVPIVSLQNIVVCPTPLLLCNLVLQDPGQDSHTPRRLRRRLVPEFAKFGFLHVCRRRRLWLGQRESLKR